MVTDIFFHQSSEHDDSSCPHPHGGLGHCTSACSKLPLSEERFRWICCPIQDFKSRMSLVPCGGSCRGWLSWWRQGWPWRARGLASPTLLSAAALTWISTLLKFRFSWLNRPNPILIFYFLMQLTPLLENGTEFYLSLDIVHEVRAGGEEHLIFDWREGGWGFQLCHRHSHPSPDFHRLDVP